MLAFAAGGMVWVVERAVRPLRRPSFGLPAVFGAYRELGSSPWDLAAASLGLVVALAVAVALWRERSITR